MSVFDRHCLDVVASLLTGEGPVMVIGSHRAEVIAALSTVGIDWKPTTDLDNARAVVAFGALGCDNEANSLLGEISSHPRARLVPLIVVEPNVSCLERLGSHSVGADNAHSSARHTGASLTALVERWGWHEYLRRDVRSTLGTIPTAIDWATPVGALLAGVRTAAADDAQISHFVRDYRAIGVRVTAEQTDPGAPRPFLSAVVRTRGDRIELLNEALTCLAAQTDSDFEVLLMVHSASNAAVAAVETELRRFSDRFQAQVRIVHVSDGGRTVPLNSALDAARGVYLAFLDDDDVVMSHWVQTFRHGATRRPGHIVRSLTVDQRWKHAGGTGKHYEPSGPWELPYSAVFDLIVHLHHNESPICSFALPVDGLRRHGLRFDSRLPVVEDWDLFIRSAMLLGVHDTAEPTSLYRRWESFGSSINHRPQLWSAAHEMVLEKLDALPLLLPAGSARIISDLAFSRDASGLVPARTKDLEFHVRRLAAEHTELCHQRDNALRRVHELETSEWWRMTGPFRWLATKLLRRGR